MSDDDLTKDIRRRIAPALVQRVDAEHIDEVLDAAAGAAVFAASRTGHVRGLPLPPALVPEPVAPVPGPEVFDLRDSFDWSHPKTKRVHDRAVVREPGGIRAIMLHQMAVTYRREGRAFAERAARAAYHVAVSDDGGEVALLKPFRVYAWHGNGANAETVGLGVEGAFPGLASRRGRKHTPIGPGLEAGLRVAMEAILAELDVDTLVAHRQSSDARRGDPGEELWTMGADVARSLGIGVDPGVTWGDGRKIPEAWGGTGPY